MLWRDFNTSATWQADIIEDASNDEETIEDTESPAAKEKKLGPRTKVTKSRRRHLLNKSKKNNVTTHISSLNLDSITMLTVSKQLECVSNSSKQFCNSLAPSELLFLTCSRNDPESPNVRHL